MNTLVLAHEAQAGASSAIQVKIANIIDHRINSLPALGGLDSTQQRGIVARYTAVLEGNFIYWMTAAYLSVRSEEARAIILDNLHEEVRDSHPVMLRKFAIAAHAFPTETDAVAVHDELTRVRLFLGRLSGAQTVLAMAYLEGFIQNFMAYLASLAIAQGSKELEYTDVHGVCDIAHTEGLFRALATEMASNPLAPGTSLFEGVELLEALIDSIVQGKAGSLSA